jgi:hypothetical protein
MWQGPGARLAMYWIKHLPNHNPCGNQAIIFLSVGHFLARSSETPERLPEIHEGFPNLAETNGCRSSGFSSCRVNYTLNGRHAEPHNNV